MLSCIFKFSRLHFASSCALLAISCITSTHSLFAQEQDDKLPRIGMAVPLAIPNSGTTKVTLRGWLLDGVSEIKVSEASAGIKILKAEKTGVPNKQEAKNVGDTQIELEVTLPEGTSFSSLKLTPVLATGAGPAYDLLVGSPFPMVKEQEPNKGFSEAQLVSLPQMIEGKIDDGQDVDVFTFEGTAGQAIRIEVIAAARGSAMDGAITLFDTNGRPLAFSDDSGDARDPQISFTLPATGRYFVALQDGLEVGGPTHPYLLKIESKQ